MTTRFLGNLAWIGMALLISLGALVAAGDFVNVIAPFGWVDVAVVHVLTALPLSMLIAGNVPRPASRSMSFLVGGAWLALGLGIAWLTITEGAVLARQFDPSAAGFFPARAFVRFSWCLCLQLPWCLSAALFTDWHLPADRPKFPLGLAVALSLLVAGLLPVAYTRSVIAAQSAKAEEQLRAGRLALAQPLIQRLCEVAASTPIGGMKPHVLRKKIDESIRVYSVGLMRPLEASASARVRLERARALAVMSRHDEAVDLLIPLAGADLGAALLLAAILQADQRWEESNQYYRTALRLVEAMPMQDATRTANRVKAYDSLAFNAREMKAHQDAEAIYHEALAAVPEAKAHFHFQLGRHYQQGGRPVEALEQLEIATRLAPEAYAKPSAPLLSQMNLHTPGCLVRWIRW